MNHSPDISYDVGLLETLGGIGYMIGPALGGLMFSILGKEGRKEEGQYQQYAFSSSRRRSSRSCGQKRGHFFFVRIGCTLGIIVS